MKEGIHALMGKIGGISAAAGAVLWLYGCLFAKKLGWRAGALRRAAAVAAVAGLLAKTLVPGRGKKRA